MTPITHWCGDTACAGTGGLRRGWSSDAELLGVRVLEGESGPRSLSRSDRPALRCARAVEEARLDPHVVVEPLLVAEVGRRARDGHRGIRCTVRGEVEVV